MGILVYYGIFEATQGKFWYFKPHMDIFEVLPTGKTLTFLKPRKANFPFLNTHGIFWRFRPRRENFGTFLL